jgi:peptidoglycan/xylan/chitin deacetylase (PgdA/CDA1 family)
MVGNASSTANSGLLGTARCITVDPAKHVDIDSLQLQEREIVLTFDDGPAPPGTEIVLDALEAEQVMATFFMVGCRSVRFGEVVRRAASAGHTIGTHSQFHQAIPSLAVDAQRREIDQGIESTAVALGTHATVAPFFRFPFLQGTPEMAAYLRSRGIMVWGANINPDDWMNFSADQVVTLALERLAVAGKGVMLLHDIEPKTALALPKLLRELKRLQYRIVHVVPVNQASSWGEATVSLADRGGAASK